MRRSALLAVAYVNTIVFVVVITEVIVVVVIVIVVESLLCSDLIFGIRRVHRRPAAMVCCAYIYRCE